MIRQPRTWSMYVFGLILLHLALNAVCAAAPLTLPSGRTVDLTTAQFDLLKKQPRVYYVQYPRGKVVSDELVGHDTVAVPASLGGGFLVGRREDVEKGIELVLADSPEPGRVDPGASPRSVRSEWALEGGLRLDDLNWSIAGYTPLDEYVNVLSELSWSDLRVYQLTLRNETIVKERFFFRGDIGYGWIYDGENQDSDYLGNDRTYEFSRSNNDAGDGHMVDASLGLGYRFTVGADAIQLIPLVGYSYHEQNLKASDGFQTIPLYGSFPGLAATYETRWSGPWAGIDVKIATRQSDAFFSKGVLLTSLEFHYADYYADADWNLRPDYAHPKSFEHKADGYGVVLNIGCQLYFGRRTALLIRYEYARWETAIGVDRVFTADGRSGTTRLNEVEWQSNVLALGVSYEF